MNKINLIATDLDSTLLTSAGHFPPDFDRTLERLLNLGVEFVAASGRPIHTLREMFAPYCDQMNFIGDNGASVMVHGEFIYTDLIAKEDYRALLTFAEDNDAAGYVTLLNALDRTYMLEKFRHHIDKIDDFFRQLVLVDDQKSVDDVINKMTIYCPARNSDEIYETLFSPAFSEKLNVAISGDVWVDVTNKGVNKGKAIGILGRHLGISPQEMMAFGDTHNDMPMLSLVAQGYAVDNAVPDIKAIANQIVDSNDNFGVQRTIEAFIDNRSSGIMTNSPI